MSHRQENVERLRPTLAEWERGNFAAGGDVLSPDVVLSAFIPDGQVVSRGWEEMGRFLRDFFSQWADYRIEVEEVTALDQDTVLMEGRQFGNGKASGIEIAELLFIVFAFQDDRVTKMYWHPNRAGALEAAGLGD